MAGSLNKVTLIGNLGRDPEVRTSSYGEIVSFSVATTDTWKDKNSGEKREKTEWHNVTIFNEGLGKTAKQYLRKGNKVYLEGNLQTEKYEKNGVTHYSTKVVLRTFDAKLIMLTPLGERREDVPQQQSNASLKQDMDDEIPF